MTDAKAKAREVRQQALAAAYQGDAWHLVKLTQELDARIATALEESFAKGTRQSNGATKEQLRQARASALEEAAGVAEDDDGLFFAKSPCHGPAVPKRIADKIRALPEERSESGQSAVRSRDDVPAPNGGSDG